MRSTLLADLLGPLGVAQTHNRPRVSNDNPFSESEFRTMKYRPNYPGIFATLDEARAYMDWYVPRYNADHKHSGIALFSPDEVHDGTGATDGLKEHAFSTPTTTPTPNDFADPHRHRRQPESWGSTSPRNARSPPNDSRQLDNARNARI
ncbi:integrase core domain-containing protein [Nocardioides sp. B-3]|uniref:integrase core domain-containing protein n=1 Tax=Nocardioides sp. B-3 TaxID=2895565 RepID=UPI002152AE7A|nr:integrase core domain-containing protein [Nocardioides sp. B-3]UUZ58652.1 integrase core domain-containing protein [Nocardioides sp. B-3]